MSTIVIVVVLTVLFFVGIGATLLAFHFLSTDEDDDELSKEARQLRRRAESNVKTAEEMEARTKRLQYLADLHRRRGV